MRIDSFFCCVLVGGLCCLHPGDCLAQGNSPKLGVSAATPSEPPAPATYSLRDLIDVALGQNPSLQQAGLGIQAAQGKALQSGLYPNPTFTFTADELGDRTGPAGILTPQLTQEIVLGGKLKLSRAVAAKEVDQATLQLQSQRYALLGSVRQSYFEILASQRRVEVLNDLVKLAAKAQQNAESLQKAKQIAEIDVLPIQIEYVRLAADLDVAERDRAAAWRRLAAVIGSPRLPMAAVAGSLEQPLPQLEFEQLRDAMLEIHPEVNSAKVGVSKADLALRRAEVEKIPNVTLSSGYTRQNQNRSNDWMFGVSVPLPIFNRNQGNVAAARADAGRSRFEVSRVENELAGKLATAFGQYSAAKQRAERYRTQILPTATRSYQMSLTAFQGGQFEYLRVIQAQRAIAEANLEYIRALGDAWRAVSEISGLLLEEDWPFAGTVSTKR